MGVLQEGQRGPETVTGVRPQGETQDLGREDERGQQPITPFPAASVPPVASPADPAGVGADPALTRCQFVPQRPRCPAGIHAASPLESVLPSPLLARRSAAPPANAPRCNAAAIPPHPGDPPARLPGSAPRPSTKRIPPPAPPAPPGPGFVPRKLTPARRGAHPEMQPFRSAVWCLTMPPCMGQFETGSRRATFQRRPRLACILLLERRPEPVPRSPGAPAPATMFVQRK